MAGRNGTHGTGARKQISLTGQTRFRTDQGAVIENAVRIGVDEGAGRIEIDGLPISALPPSMKTWTNEDVVRALRWIALELEKRAYAARPIQSFFKPEKPEPRPEDEVPCPCCNAEAWPSCPLCDGYGRTTRREAECWRRGA